MSIMPLSEFSGEKNESRDNRVMQWRERYYRQEATIATIKAQRDELLKAAKNAAIDLRGTPDGAALEAAIANAERSTKC